MRTIDPVFIGSTPAPVSGNPSYRLRRPSCRRRGALRNVGAATVGPAVPLTVSFSLCPPSRRNNYLYVCPECHLGAHRHIRAQTHTQRYSTNIQTSLHIKSVFTLIRLSISFSLAIFFSMSRLFVINTLTRIC